MNTPGPWSADQWATGWTVSAPESHYSVCHLEDCNNAQANASLIAAAPDLLEAAKLAEYAFECASLGKAYVNPLASLSAAIAKAQGLTPAEKLHGATLAEEKGA